MLKVSLVFTQSCSLFEPRFLIALLITEQMKDLVADYNSPVQKYQNNFVFQPVSPNAASAVTTKQAVSARTDKVMMTTQGTSSLVKNASNQDDQLSRNESRNGRCRSGQGSFQKNGSQSSSRQKKAHQTIQIKSGHSYLAQTLISGNTEPLSVKELRKGLVSPNEGAYSNTNISSRQRRDGQSFNSAIQRNINTASGGLRSGNTTNRSKFIKRPMLGNQSKNITADRSSRSPHALNVNPINYQHLNTELSPAGATDLNLVYTSDHSEEPNLNLTQTEQLDMAPRETYTATGGPISPDGFKTLDTFYRTPNQKALNTANFQHFSPDRIISHGGLKTAASKTRPHRMNGQQHVSPRATYYSPVRDPSEPKEFFLYDTVPVSPQRQTITPQHNMALKTFHGQKPETAMNSNSPGKTNLGTSYDFNKLKKGLKSVQNRNLASEKASAYQNEGSKQKSDLNEVQTDKPQPKARDVEEANNKKEADRAQPVQEGTQEKKKEEEVIIFSNNHSTEDYVFGSKIGQGAYATVHIGMNKKVNKRVALKIYLKDKMKDLQRKKSVRREIKLMKRLDHPNIAKMYDAIETETKVILVLEYVGGGSTHGFLKSKPNRQMQEHEAQKIFSQLMSALNYLHSKCIAHRDIKLENVMLDSKGNVKLIDFGFSTQIPNTQKIKLFCGTPSYMAPEIVRKIEFCGPPADIYAAGVLLFAFFCGCFPFRGSDDKDLYKKIASADLVIPEHVPAIPRHFIGQMLQKDPENRPTSHELFAETWVQDAVQTNLANSKKSHTRSTSLKHRIATARDVQSTVSPHRNLQMISTPLSDHRMYEKDQRQMITTQMLEFATGRPQTKPDQSNLFSNRYDHQSKNFNTRKNSKKRSPMIQDYDEAQSRGQSSQNQHRYTLRQQASSGNHNFHPITNDAADSFITTQLNDQAQALQAQLQNQKPKTPGNQGWGSSQSGLTFSNLQSSRINSKSKTSGKVEPLVRPEDAHKLDPAQKRRALQKSPPKASAISPNSHRFPAGKRKQSGAGGIYNSEAYKAYYTHSSATNPSQITANTAKPSHIDGLNDANLPSSSDQSHKTMPHQTINNNINIINYITQIACPHKEPHSGPCTADAQVNPQQSKQTKQQIQKQKLLNNNWMDAGKRSSQARGTQGPTVHQLTGKQATRQQ